ncbi:MAG: phosphoglycerate kinase [Thermoleophilia bacterium]
MPKRTVRDIDVSGKRVMVRVDFNVPLAEGAVVDDMRIVAALPTIEYLRERGARVILVSHLGRPEKGSKADLALDPVATHLAHLLNTPVRKLDELSGPSVELAVHLMEAGEVILLENSRFDPREKSNDPELAEELARLADVFVNDAFGVCHRAHATTVGVPALVPAVAGFLLEKELEMLGSLLTSPRRPFVVVIGGSKVSDKIGVIERFLELADAILVGGAMCFTFFRAQGMSVGSSRVEGEEGVALARRLLDKAAGSACDLLLPTDIVVADAFAADAAIQVVPADAIPEGWMGLDIGPETAASYAGRVESAGEVFWNGPMGVFELEPFAAGTEAIARAMAACEGVTVVGGGDSVAALRALGLEGRMDHVSTGGGASLEFIEGGDLPGVSALMDR